MELTATPRENRLAVALTISNTGDEAARSVVPSVHFRGSGARAPRRESLAPRERMEVTLDVPWERDKPGQWPLAVRVDYEDGNGHPFQAHHVALVATPGATAALVPVIDVEAEPVAASGSVRARLKSLSNATYRAQVRFFAPLGLEAEPALRTLTVEPWADAVVRAEIRNRGALPGSRYPVYVAVEYDDEAGHHAAVGHAIVEVQAATERRVSYFWAAAALVVAWLAFLGWRRWGYMARARA
ncbi:MAG TPA: hypothetical protein VMR21_12550 [Vicinamibacteria bacterium]|nr:hypothetical protein [Vicinamibacteria bacterium]